MNDPDYRILLVGNPNCGKSSLFNHLTGLKQKTGNFQGVTVEKLTGYITASSGNDSLHNRKIEIIDLPGSFSLGGNSEDKLILTRFLMNRQPNDRIIFVMDTLLIERSLQFFFQIADLGIPLLVVLTMKDLLVKKNINISVLKLEKELGVNISLLNAKNGENIEELKEKLFTPESFKLPGRLWQWEKKREDFLTSILRKTGSKTDSIRFVISNALKELSGEKLQSDLPGLNLLTEESRKIIESDLEKTELRFTYQDELIVKSIKIKSILAKTVQTSIVRKKAGLSQLDKILLHPKYGIVVFLALMVIIFQALFSWSEIPMNLIEQLFSYLSLKTASTLPPGPLAELIVNGAIGGVGSVMVFIPQIAFLFLFIGIMEETGYMARASFVMDRFMGRFGLSGKSFIPLLSSSACAVPAIMGARTIENKTDRIITIMVSPFITCSARYPVYILVIGTIFPEGTFFGMISWHATIMFALFMLGIITSLLFALLFRKTWFRQEASYFIMEIPEFKSPSIRHLLMNVYKKVKMFTFRTGGIIFSISIILWFLANYPKIEINKQLTNNNSLIENSATTPKEIGILQMQNSYAGKIGSFIEPAIKPLGFDWKIGIAIITSFAAREVMVSTLAVIYGSEDDANSMNLHDKMRSDIDPKTGNHIWSIPTAISLLIFFAYASQCMATLATVRRETNSIFWPAFMFAYMTGLAVISSFTIYQITSYFYK